MNGGVNARIAALQARISAACAEAGRDRSTVQLLAVSKGQGIARLQEAFAAGQRHFAENYVQEALPKLQALQGSGICWHHIGRVQSNKTRDIAEQFDWVHGLDRLKLAERLSQQRPQSLPALNVCVQVNLAREAGKAGCSPEQLPALSHAIAALPRLRLRGLMLLPEAAQTSEEARTTFATLKQWLTTLNSEGLGLDSLSMGMSADFEAAIQEGATLIRVGSALFGSRP